MKFRNQVDMIDYRIVVFSFQQDILEWHKKTENLSSQ